MDKDIFEKDYIPLLDEINNELIVKGGLKTTDIAMYNPLVLAYIGDCVYELYVRTLLVSHGSIQVAKLHKRAITFVKAKSQAEFLEEVIQSELTDDEKDIVRRGRNAKSGTVPKNAELVDYRMATGLEALFGYLYLIGDIERLVYLFDKIRESKEGD